MAFGKSLNGWQRVGFVLSALVCILAAIIGHDATDRLFTFYYADGEIMGMTGQAQTDAVWMPGKFWRSGAFPFSHQVGDNIGRRDIMPVPGFVAVF